MLSHNKDPVHELTVLEDQIILCLLDAIGAQVSGFLHLVSANEKVHKWVCKTKEEGLHTLYTLLLQTTFTRKLWHQGENYVQVQNKMTCTLFITIFHLKGGPKDYIAYKKGNTKTSSIPAIPQICLLTLNFYLESQKGTSYHLQCNGKIWSQYTEMFCPFGVTRLFPFLSIFTLTFDIKINRVHPVLFCVQHLLSNMMCQFRRRRTIQFSHDGVHKVQLRDVDIKTMNGNSITIISPPYHSVQEKQGESYPTPCKQLFFKCDLENPTGSSPMVTWLCKVW